MSKRQSILNEFLESGKFDPVEYMRRTRPEHFSDSVVTREPAIDPDYFEYHLESLTSRSQEIQFENFARRLAEVEICPNLRPQTGPTGGGDSKTDSSTYPVAQELADRTYWGTPVQATNENCGIRVQLQEGMEAQGEVGHEEDRRPPTRIQEGVLHQQPICS